MDEVEHSGTYPWETPPLGATPFEDPLLTISAANGFP